jgi:hypothetical protein
MSVFLGWGKYCQLASMITAFLNTERWSGLHMVNAHDLCDHVLGTEMHDSGICFEDESKVPNFNTNICKL